MSRVIIANGSNMESRRTYGYYPNKPNPEDIKKNLIDVIFNDLNLEKVQASQTQDIIQTSEELFPSDRSMIIACKDDKGKNCVIIKAIGMRASLLESYYEQYLSKSETMRCL